MFYGVEVRLIKLVILCVLLLKFTLVADLSDKPKNRFVDGYFFIRCDEPENKYPIQDINKSWAVFEQIKAMEPWPIDFDAYKLEPFDESGTCTAMALDFLARYINVAKPQTNLSDRIRTIFSFEHYYKSNSITFVSRQAAFNTITIESDARKNFERDLLKELKMKALANYHQIELSAITSTIKPSELESTPGCLQTIVDELPDGEYVLRLVQPEENEKQEAFGHTMIVIKDKDLSIFYDNAEGALKVNYKKLGSVIEERCKIRFVNKDKNLWILSLVLDFIFDLILGPLNFEIMIFHAYAYDGVCENLAE